MINTCLTAVNARVYRSTCCSQLREDRSHKTEGRVTIITMFYLIFGQDAIDYDCFFNKLAVLTAEYP